MTKKRPSEILAVKWGIFFRKNRHSEILVREKNFRPPQIRRQGSATGQMILNYRFGVATTEQKFKVSCKLSE